MGIIGLPFVWVGHVKVISSEEFSFENINNLTLGKGLKIFNGGFCRKDTVRESFIYVMGVFTVRICLG